MKNQRNFWLVAVLGFAALLLTVSVPYATSHAAGQGGQIQMANPKDLKVATDLVVYVRAYSFAYEKGVKAIPEGANVEAYNTGDFKFVFSVVNQGKVAAENFTYKLVVRDQLNNQKVYDPPAAKLTLQPGETKIFTANLAGQSTSYFEAKVLADIGNLVPEINESNNLAALKFKFTQEPK